MNNLELKKQNEETIAGLKFENERFEENIKNPENQFFEEMQAYYSYGYKVTHKDKDLFIDLLKYEIEKNKGEINHIKQELQQVQTDEDKQRNHPGLESNVPFDELPEWFKNASTFEATVEYRKDGAFMWLNGTWDDGIWEGTKWYNGIWNNGTWNYGIWERGIWNNGAWNNGTWIDGTWERGVWHLGTWFYGTWKNGVWNNGIWNDGVWVQGTWINGVWCRGHWHLLRYENEEWDHENYYNER